MPHTKIKHIGAESIDPRLEHILEAITRIPSVVGAPVCLPDVHIKEKTEAPASFVVATVGTIIPELTAPSVGCGMGVLATSLTRADVQPEAFKKFYTAMRGHLGPRYGFYKNLLLWLGILKRPRNKYDFTPWELEDIIYNGASGAARKYNVPESTLSHIEYGGNVMDPELARMFKPHDLLPRSAWISGLHDIGYGFKGNHFLEIQYVDEIFDEATARAWDLKKDQIIIMYHGGGGAVSHYVGRYFANRKKNKRREKPTLFFAKLLFHFGSRGSIKHVQDRWRYYFRPHPFQEVPLESYEGKRLLAATQASLNYSYAFRLAIAKRIMDSLAEAFGPDAHASLLWDTIHNSIARETIGEQQVVIHRHTATRVFESKPVIVSGFNTTSSYIGIGLHAADENLFSADHGAGKTIKKFTETGKVTSHPQALKTYIYTTKPPYIETVTHITDEGVDHVMNSLADAGITRPVVKLRPLAVFKG